jgi:hypothetical protein
VFQAKAGSPLVLTEQPLLSPLVQASHASMEWIEGRMTHHHLRDVLVRNSARLRRAGNGFKQTPGGEDRQQNSRLQNGAHGRTLRRNGWPWRPHEEQSAKSCANQCQKDRLPSETSAESTSSAIEASFSVEMTETVIWREEKRVQSLYL